MIGDIVLQRKASFVVAVVLFKHRAKSSIAQEERLATSPTFFDKASPAARDSSGVACALNLRCYPPPDGNGGQLVFEQQPILVGWIFHPE